MARGLRLVAHLTLSDIDERYRTTEFGVERAHWRIIWLMGQGRTVTEIASIVRRSPKWIREIVHRYNEAGPDALGDRRQTNRGAAPLLDKETEAVLRLVIDGPPPGGGRWTSAKVAQWMSDRLDRPVPVQRGWVYLRRLREETTTPPSETHEPEDVTAETNVIAPVMRARTVRQKRSAE